MERVEPEAAARVRDVDVIEPPNHGVHAAACLPRRTRQAAGEEHVVLRLEALQLRFENLEFTIEVGDFPLGHPAIILDHEAHEDS